jgi:L-aspartate oxidase
MAHLQRAKIQAEFPTIYEKLKTIGLDITTDWIPVVPAQHYSCGGVKTDLQGRTSIPGLYAAGEVACTGVHGANRLASNSLLEALVFARAAGLASPIGEVAAAPADKPKARAISESRSIHIRRALQKTMTDRVAIVRTNAGLAEAKKDVDRLIYEYENLPEAAYSQHPLETYNLLLAARSAVEGAINRKVNVGLHYNSDLA